MAQKKITVAVCVCDRLGMMFNNRRQSKDRLLIHNLLSTYDGDVYIHPYSRTLFEENPRIHVSDNPLGDCADGALAFIENLPILPYAKSIDRLIIYKWNTNYPYDKQLDIDTDALGLTLVEESDFVGSSHDLITKEIYTK